MPRWDNKCVCHSNFINQTLQQIIDYENNNKDRKKPKNSVEKARRNCRCNLNQKLFSENIIFDPFNIFLKSAGTISNRIL